RYADVRLEPGTDVRAWIDAEAANVRAVIRTGCSVAPDLAVLLIRLLHFSLDACDRWADGASLNLLAIETTTRTRDRFGSAVAWEDLAWHQFRMGRVDESTVAINQALSIYRELGEITQVVSALPTLAALHLRKRQFGLAVSVDREAVALARIHASRVTLA